MSSDTPIHDYFNLGWRRKWLVLLPALLGLLASWLVWLKTPPVYQARATLVDEHEAQGYEGNRKTVWDNPKTALERLQRDDFVMPVARRIADVPPDGEVEDDLPGRVRRSIFVELIGKLPFDLMDAGLSPILLRTDPGVGEALQLDIVQRVYRLQTKDAIDLLKTAHAQFPKNGSEKVKAALTAVASGRPLPKVAP